MDKLFKVKGNKELKIFCILSYGGTKKYIKSVIEYGNKFALVLIYIAVFILAAMTKMYVTYEIGNLGAKKNTLETQLKEIKTEVEALDYNLIKNYNMKRAEEKARDLGFETIDNIRYINIK